MVVANCRLDHRRAVRHRLRDVVPLIGSVIGAGAGLVALAFTMVVGGVVIAMAWFWYRPLVGIAVLAAGLVAGILARRLATSRSAARPSPAPA
ncbi:MAG: TMEM43 family protein [Xanthobacteraceae bacterium]